ncbi:Patched domain-containing protein 2 [Exaiptasia diaphana]|nr:Patched domain-containing protein 2 [Exaiptasia diaphana]
MLMWYYKFDKFLKAQIKKIGDEALDSAFHSSESWVHMFMEVIAISGAIYGIVFSLCLCLIAVVIFTGHLMLSIIAIFTILGVLCFVVGIFYLVEWQLGAVEAISLSILVGTSVDYCVHLIDGYIISGRYVPRHLTRNKDIRSWRTAAAVSHIGSSILSSAMTTIAASIPLCFTTIQLFAKFGQILAINTAISIVYTLSFSLAFLTIFAPAKFIRTWKSRGIAVVAIAIVVGMVTLILYIISLKGTPIPGPDGNPLFSV